MSRSASVFVIALLLGEPALAADEVTSLTARELAVETSRWKNKKIETVMPCAYADVNDYRCVSAKGSRIHFKTITNEEGRQHLEKNCTTLGKTTTSQCTVRIVFVYADYQRVERQNRIVTLVSAEGDKGEIFTLRRR
jgi:hypothetical protein